jgi:serine/threonine protein kinase
MVHKGFKPSSLLIYPASLRVGFLDLSHASLLFRDTADPQASLSEHSDTLLPYMSPEMTGKANRPIDLRSDLYSLSCILHECTSGSPPFVSHVLGGRRFGAPLDPMELMSIAADIMHCHLAKSPPPLVSPNKLAGVAPALVPPLQILAQILGRLLAKSADDRYQSARGLSADLSYCLRLLQYRSAGDGVHPASPPLVPALADFRCGQLDDYSTFRVSQKLYGREKQIEQLVAAYARVSGGVGSPNMHSRSTTATTIGGIGGIGQAAAVARHRSGLTVAPQLLLVSGFSGIGKTALVRSTNA